jgi:hypothetical protein
MTTVALPVEAERNSPTLTTPPTKDPRYSLDGHMQDAGQDLDKFVHFFVPESTASDAVKAEHSPAQARITTAPTTTAPTTTAMDILSEPSNTEDAKLLKRAVFEPCAFHVNTNDTSTREGWGSDDDQTNAKRRRKTSSPEQDEKDLLKALLRSPKGRRDDRGVDLVDSFEL